MWIYNSFESADTAHRADQLLYNGPGKQMPYGSTAEQVKKKEMIPMRGARIGASRIFRIDPLTLLNRRLCP